MFSMHRRDLQSTETELDQVINIYNKKLINPHSTNISTDTLKDSINSLEKHLENLRKVKANKLLFGSKIKYINEGEKCSKYFLNTLNRKLKRTYIPSISINNQSFSGRDLGPEILKFYPKLYEADESVSESSYIYFSVINKKLTDEQSESLDTELTLDELFNTLKSCKESSPGPDAIPYSIYKKFWKILGPPLLNS